MSAPDYSSAPRWPIDVVFWSKSAEISHACTKCSHPLLNRIQGTIAYMRPLKLQASLQARDLIQSRKLVGVGHRFGKVGVLAIMSSKIYPGKLEWTLNADCLKFNGQFAKPNKSFIGPAIVAFVRRKLGNFRETQKLQQI